MLDNPTPKVYPLAMSNTDPVPSPPPLHVVIPPEVQLRYQGVKGRTPIEVKESAREAQEGVKAAFKEKGELAWPEVSEMCARHLAYVLPGQPGKEQANLAQAIIRLREAARQERQVLASQSAPSELGVEAALGVLLPLLPPALARQVVTALQEREDE